MLIVVYFATLYLARLTCQSATRPNGQAKQGPPLIGHKLDIGWQGRLVSGCIKWSGVVKLMVFLSEALKRVHWSFLHFPWQSTATIDFYFFSDDSKHWLSRAGRLRAQWAVQWSCSWLWEVVYQWQILLLIDVTCTYFSRACSIDNSSTSVAGTSVFSCNARFRLPRLLVYTILGSIDALSGVLYRKYDSNNYEDIILYHMTLYTKFIHQQQS